MAGFALNHDGQWRDVIPTSRTAHHLGEALLYTPSREEMRAILMGFGRPKDLRRADLLR
jgi:hypothetical protein